MSRSRSIIPASQPAGETSKKSQADELGDNNNDNHNSNVNNKIGDDEKKKPEAHLGTTPVDTTSQDPQLEKKGNPTSGSPMPDSETLGMSSDNSRPMQNKENKGPEPSTSQSEKDYSVEFAEWKGSSNPSCPKWGPPPYLRGSSNSPPPSGSTARSNGICPGMGAWSAR